MLAKNRNSLASETAGKENGSGEKIVRKNMSENFFKRKKKKIWFWIFLEEN